MQVDGLSEPVGMTVLQSWYQVQQTLFGPEKSFHMELQFLAHLGSSFALVNFQEVMSAYKGVRRLDSLFYVAMTEKMEEKLHQRGQKYRNAATSSPYVQYSRGSFFAHGRGVKHANLSSGRVMLDTKRGHEYGHHAARGGDNCSIALQQAMRTFKLQQKHGTETLRLVEEPRESELWMAWPAMVGFSFTAKCWGQVLVADTSPIHFRADAFEQLVLPNDTKEIIRQGSELDWAIFACPSWRYLHSFKILDATAKHRASLHDDNGSACLEPRSAVRHAGTSGLDFIEGKAPGLAGKPGFSPFQRWDSFPL